MTREVVFDVDPGCDDAAMLALALASEEIDVAGVTTVAGNAPSEDVTRNALGVLERMGAEDVPIVPGCDRPLVRELETAEGVHGLDGLPGVRPNPSMVPAGGEAVSFLLERSKEVEDLTLAATAPLTNVAVALSIDPGLADRVDLYVMGGAAHVGGNVTAAAEYNFYADPEAAARVVRDAAPRIVPLDVTNRARLSPEYVESLAREDEPLRSIAGWLAYATPEEVLEGIDESVPLHDPAVVIDLIGDVLEYEPAALEVDHTSGPSRGALVRDERDGHEPNADLATGIDEAGFRSVVRSVLGTL